MIIKDNMMTLPIRLAAIACAFVSVFLAFRTLTSKVDVEPLQEEYIPEQDERVSLEADDTLFYDTPVETNTSAAALIDNWMRFPATEREFATPADKRTTFVHQISKGENLAVILADYGLDTLQLTQLIETTEGKKLARSIRPGKEVVLVCKGSTLEKLQYKASQAEQIVAVWSKEGVSVSTVDLIESTERRLYQGEVRHLLFTDAIESGIPHTVVNQLPLAFGGQIDFSRDIQSGDTFRVIVEDLSDADGNIIKSELLAAKFVNRGKAFHAIRHKNQDHKAYFYNEDGENLSRSMFALPIPSARISSHFNLKRYHPILKQIRPHKGTDFAASRGTPILAAADGTLSYKGYKGGYGKTIMIDHAQGYSTLYAHMNGYALGIQTGKKVRQGQVIGYVGSTGRSTGPHLHYEVRQNKRHIDPMTVKMAGRQKLAGAELEAFKMLTKPLVSALDQDVAGTRIALKDLDDVDTL
jgi:murein DD-endopeptidase MepM/ murein hydrolase activator NlpD